MISNAFAADQLARIMGMVGFPKGPDSDEYVKEMRKAIMGALSEAVAERVVSDILREFKRCPAVSDLYEAVSDENSRVGGIRAPKCAECGGNGAVTFWVLVTYHGRSMNVKAMETLPGFDVEKAKEFGKELRWDDGPITPENPFAGDNQQIITAAKPCRCKLEGPILASSASCKRCDDCGHYGGDLPPSRYAGPWKWCNCATAMERKNREPNLVDEANRVRDGLLAKFPDGKIALRRIPRMDSQELREDRYFGDF